MVFPVIDARVSRPSPVDASLDHLLRQLGLKGARSRWIPISRQAEREGWSHEEFLTALLQEELSQRAQRPLTR